MRTIASTSDYLTASEFIKVQLPPISLFFGRLSRILYRAPVGYHRGYAELVGRTHVPVQEQSMKTRTFVGIFLALAASMPAQAGDWKLVWNDEFDKPGLADSTKWGYESGFLRNHEKQFYTPARTENARVENGMLVIEARKERYSSPIATSSRKARAKNVDADYTSASLTTRGKAQWTYGRFEVRAKLPSGRGTWPAIWMLGTNIDQVGWPSCGEIDIMEFVGYEPGVIHANVHTKKYNHVLHTGKGDKTPVSDASVTFHVYAVEWDDQKIDFFVDDHKTFTFRNERTGTDAWPYGKDQYLIINLAIGGDWGGQKGIDDRIFPQRYYIDYVRVYQQSNRNHGQATLPR
jgi:beta-glucanase (GH16 family)